MPIACLSGHGIWRNHPTDRDFVIPSRVSRLSFHVNHGGLYDSYWDPLWMRVPAIEPPTGYHSYAVAPLAPASATDGRVFTAGQVCREYRLSCPYGIETTWKPVHNNVRALKPMGLHIEKMAPGGQPALAALAAFDIYYLAPKAFGGPAVKLTWVRLSRLLQVLCAAYPNQDIEVRWLACREIVPNGDARYSLRADSSQTNDADAGPGKLGQLEPKMGTIRQALLAERLSDAAFGARMSVAEIMAL